MSNNARSLWRFVMLAGAVALPTLSALPALAHGTQEPAGAPQAVLTDMMDAATARKSETGSSRGGPAEGDSTGGTSWILWGSLVTSLGAAGILLTAILYGHPQEQTSAAGGTTTADTAEALRTEAPVRSKQVPRQRPHPAQPAFPVSDSTGPHTAGPDEATARHPHDVGSTAEEDAPRDTDDTDLKQAPPPAPSSNPYATPEPSGPSVDHWIPRCGPEG